MAPTVAQSTRSMGKLEATKDESESWKKLQGSAPKEPAGIVGQGMDVKLKMHRLEQWIAEVK